jgi:hypothetical protein
MIKQKDLCEKLNISMPTMINWRKKGLPCYEVGGHVFIKEDELELFFIDQNRLKKEKKEAK